MNRLIENDIPVNNDIMPTMDDSILGKGSWTFLEKERTTFNDDFSHSIDSVESKHNV